MEGAAIDSTWGGRKGTWEKGGVNRVNSLERVFTGREFLHLKGRRHEEKKRTTLESSCKQGKRTLRGDQEPREGEVRSHRSWPTFRIDPKKMREGGIILEGGVRDRDSSFDIKRLMGEKWEKGEIQRNRRPRIPMTFLIIQSLHSRKGKGGEVPGRGEGLHQELESVFLKERKGGGS